MQGAKEYARIFETGQYGNFYIVSGSHARGKTFHIYILPKGEEAESAGPNNPPHNENKVEVYGITGGQPGWTETYGWLHEGKWQEDFYRLYGEKKRECEERKWEFENKQQQSEDDKRRRELEILSAYKGGPP